MKAIKIFSLFLVFITLVLTFSSCKEEEKFEKTDYTVTTTITEKQTENFTFSNFEVFNVKMGMSVSDAQKALNQLVDVKTSDNGEIFFTVNMTDLPFVTKGMACTVYFIFDEKARLVQIQYISLNTTGFKESEVISTFNKNYGKHATNKSTTDKTSYVWLSDDVYIIATVYSNGQNAITYFAKDYFEKNYKTETEAYKNLG